MRGKITVIGGPRLSNTFLASAQMKTRGLVGFPALRALGVSDLSLLKSIALQGIRILNRAQMSPQSA